MMTNVKVQRKTVLSPGEIEGMNQKADSLPNEFFQLRAKAFLAILRGGNRIGEIAALQLIDLKAEGQFLFVTFNVEKKRKKNPFTTSYSIRFPLESPEAKNILTLKSWFEVNLPRCKYLFPSGHSCFGNYTIDTDAHLTTRQLLNILKHLNPLAWNHLFRETRGAEIVRRDEREKGEASLETVYRVKRALHLEREETAFRYINRYASEKVEPEGIETIS